MAQCEYCGIFYRILFVALVAIAFIFTLILTNVFIDIDDLLSDSRRVKEQESTTLNQDGISATEERLVVHVEEKSRFFNDVKNLEVDNSYRNKRSVESPVFKYHIQNPKLKSILTDRLSRLLEDIDNEESNHIDKLGTTERLREKHALESVEYRRLNSGNNNDINHEKDLLHLTMHNILLQGIIGHMDLNDVYAKVNSIVSNLRRDDRRLEIGAEVTGNDQIVKTKSDEIPKDQIEKQFFNELVKCIDLQKQIKEKMKGKIVVKRRTVDKKTKGPKMLIKTVIDISSLQSDNSNENSTNPSEINGVIKLIYNGKSVKFNQIDEENEIRDTITKDAIQTISKNPKSVDENDVSNYLKDNFDINVPNAILTSAINNYFQNYADKRSHLQTRMKRNIKSNHGTDKKAKEDEELYVEIETHFDGKGVKGERKKKLVRDIIDRIQKAIHTDVETFDDMKPEQFYVRKRLQDPLDFKPNSSALLNKILIPLDAVVKREMDPLTKTYPVNGAAPQVAVKSGETWKHLGPHFLSGTKAINSAEVGEVEVNYNKGLKDDLIPQRLQQPLNPNSEDAAKSSYEFGNLKFFIKELDGTGFSIGFNQYLGGPPDEESIKSFTGVDSLINDIHKKYEKSDEADSIVVKSSHEHELTKRDANFGTHPLPDYHSNEYKIIFNHKFLPYDTYQEIIEDRDKKVHLSIQKENDTEIGIRSSSPDLDEIQPSFHMKKNTLIIDENILNKDLRPSQIFGLANLFGRKKRSVKMQKYTKVHMKTKMNRYLNTNTMPNNKIYLKNRSRSKRQVDNIRIVSADEIQSLPRHSDENIFVISDENLFTDRAVVREMEQPDGMEPSEKMTEDHYDYIGPVGPYIFNRPSQYHPFGGRSRHNALMSKYPHILMEEISRSKEEQPEPFIDDVIPEKHRTEHHEYAKYNPVSIDRENDPKEEGLGTNLDQIVDAISPRSYRLTVKIQPKNETNEVNAGFKEIHTSINKSISKNGLIFSSLVNVSEVSKVEKVNKSNGLTRPVVTSSPLVKHIKTQQEKMKVLLRQHKKRIEQQLEHLNKERQSIDSYMTDHASLKKVNNDLIDVLLPSDPPQSLHLTKDEAGELISSALMKLRDQPHLNDIVTTSPKTETITPAIRMLTTTTTRPTIDPEKARIIQTIQRNENLTNTILSKIDRNTELLQGFLRKLSERLDNKPLIPQRIEETPEVKLDWRDRVQIPFLSKPMPNLEVDKNVTHMSIPFVYAYQQPYPLPSNNEKSNVASVIYQGHIHTNAIGKNLAENRIDDKGKGNNSINGNIKSDRAGDYGSTDAKLQKTISTDKPSVNGMNYNTKGPQRARSTNQRKTPSFLVPQLLRDSFAK